MVSKCYVSEGLKLKLDKTAIVPLSGRRKLPKWKNIRLGIPLDRKFICRARKGSILEMARQAIIIQT